MKTAERNGTTFRLPTRRDFADAVELESRIDPLLDRVRKLESQLRVSERELGTARDALQSGNHDNVRDIADGGAFVSPKEKIAELDRQTLSLRDEHDAVKAAVDLLRGEQDNVLRRHAKNIRIAVRGRIAELKTEMQNGIAAFDKAYDELAKLQKNVELERLPVSCPVPTKPVLASGAPLMHTFQHFFSIISSD